MKQGTGEWFQARVGRVTASNVWKVLDFKKDGKETAERVKYRAQIVAETLTGMASLSGFLSPEMQRGNDCEEEAREAYEIETGRMVDQVGFVNHPTIERAGASPDGTVGDEGLLEIKNPKTETHLAWMEAGKVPDDHEPQMMWQMACDPTRKWNDFMSYDNRLPRQFRKFIVRLHRDEARIAEIEAAVVKFLAEVDEAIDRLRLLYPSAPPQELLRDQLEASLISDEDFAYSPGMAYAPDNATVTEG